jgi:hypothetical protein
MEDEDPQAFIEQLLAMDYTKRGRPEIGGAEMDRAAGMGVTARGGQRQPPKALEDVVYDWASGKATPGDVRSVFKDHGWKVDLRRGRYDVEAYDPDGNTFYIQP